MTVVTWPHGHLPHALADFLRHATAAEERVYTRLPRSRTYPLVVVQPAGLGALGTDAAIQADEVRLQIDAWAETQGAAATVAAQVFRLLDARFGGTLRFTTLVTEDETEPGTYYESKIEWIRRSGGGEVYFDEIARVFRVTAFYNVKVNL